MESIAMTRLYNEMTGASATHHDIEGWGWIESVELEYAIQFMRDN